MAIDGRKWKKIKRDIILFIAIFTCSLVMAAVITIATDDPAVSAALALSSDDKTLAELANIARNDEPIERTRKINELLREKLDPDTFDNLRNLYMGRTRYGGDYNAISP